jgi:6-phosphogluconolactonase (cycloisomerase 2 family)
MKKAVFAAMLLAPFLSGCSGFWNPPATTTATTTTLSGGNFFLVDSTTASLVSYTIASGELTLVGSYPMPAAPIAVAVAPNGDYLAVSTADGVYIYTIATGVLTQGNSGSDITTDPATAIAIDATSTWILEASSAGVINAIPVVSSTGSLDSTRSPQAVTTNSTTVNQLAFSPNKAFVFAALGTNGLAGYTFSATAAAPLGTAAYVTKGPVSSSAGAAISVAVDPSSRMVYVGETAATTGTNSGGLRAFALTTSTGALTELSGSPISSGGTGPYSILPKSTGDYVYVANWQGESSGNITGFSITASTSTASPYTLAKVTSSATGIRPMAIVEDSDKNFVLAANAGGSPNLEAYIFDTTTDYQLDTVISSSTYAATSVVALP